MSSLSPARAGAVSSRSAEALIPSKRMRARDRDRVRAVDVSYLRA